MTIISHLLRFFSRGLPLMCMCWATWVGAQPAPNPMDVVPEKMPFDIPYGTTLSTERAGQVLDAALAESKKRNWKLICAVVDPSGFLITMRRMDQAQIASIDIAIHKARAASKFRRETKALENADRKSTRLNSSHT